MKKNKILHDLNNNKISKIPIEYISQYKNFYKNLINIYFPTLIARNDSLKIIYILKKIYSNYFIKNVFDLGFGSGIFYFSIKNEIKNLKYISIDNIYVNSKIISKNKKKIFIFYYNWIYFFYSFKKQNIIISNPPYLSSINIKNYNIKYESKNNLISHQNGLKNIFDIIKYSYDVMNKNSIILIEHGYFQSKKIRKILKKCGYTNIYTNKDIKNLLRITYAEK